MTETEKQTFSDNVDKLADKLVRECDKRVPLTALNKTEIKIEILSAFSKLIELLKD